MGTLDRDGSVAQREIKIADITGKTPEQIESAFNDNYGKIGWRIIQIFDAGSKRYILAEREI